MPIEVNGTPVNDGDPLEVNGVQAQEVKVNGETVWVNTIPPSAIVDLTVSSNRVGQVQIYFTPSVGLPNPIHDLYRNGLLWRTGVQNGDVFAVEGGDYSFYIQAFNSAGTITSNTANGRSQVAAGNRTYVASNSNIVLPAGVKTITVCMCGGGGGGVNGRNGGGGGSGSVSRTGIAYNGSAMNFTQGGGGSHGFPNGLPGGTSTLSGGGITTISAAGGNGGSGNIGGSGVNGGGRGGEGDPWTAGGSSSGCGGSYAGGNPTNNNHGGGGGAGGYGNGGVPSVATPANGGGGGAGGHLNNDFPARTGAAGQCRISWNQH